MRSSMSLSTEKGPNAPTQTRKKEQQRQRARREHDRSPRRESDKQNKETCHPNNEWNELDQQMI